jgi:hypothetical protein
VEEVTRFEIYRVRKKTKVLFAGLFFARARFPATNIFKNWADDAG